MVCISFPDLQPASTTKYSLTEFRIGCRYATSPDLNSYTALIHDRYSQKTSPYPAVHLTLDPETLEFKAYVAAQVRQFILDPRENNKD
jgi:hypothetical protein